MKNAYPFLMNEIVSFMNDENKTVFAKIKNIRRNYYPNGKPPTTEYFLTELSGTNLKWMKEINLKKVDDETLLKLELSDSSHLTGADHRPTRPNNCAISKSI